MLEVKNVNEIETMNVCVQERISQLQSQMSEAEIELKLLSLVERTSRWFEELLPILTELDNDARNIDVLKKTIRQTRRIDSYIDGLLGFDEGWLTTVQIKITSIRKRLVPMVFHDYLHHRNWFNDIYALVETYPMAYLNNSKVDKICLIIKAIESINAWCLHQLYVLDENPRLGR